MKDLEALDGPAVVIATNDSLEIGFSRSLFVQWAQDERNLLLLVNRGQQDSLANLLYQTWKKVNDAKESNFVLPAINLHDVVITIQVHFKNLHQVKRKDALVGEELEQHRKAEAVEKERLEAEAAMIAHGKDILDADDESDDSDNEEIGVTSITVNSAIRLDLEQLFANSYDVYAKSQYNNEGFFRHSQNYVMFPYSEKRIKFDDYGEAIVPDQYVREIPAAAIEGQPSFGDEEEKLNTILKMVEIQSINSTAQRR